MSTNLVYVVGPANIIYIKNVRIWFEPINFPFIGVEYDYEFDSIEQVSDYDNSEASENNSNVDLYSIVSIPKPKLEPFFKNNSNPDLRSIGSNSLGLLNVKSVEREQHVSFNSSTPTNKKSLKKNRSSSLTSAYNTTEKCQSNVEGLKKVSCRRNL